MPSYRIWGATVDGAIEFESLTTETLEPALQIIRDYFFRDENVSRCVGLDSDIGGADELIELCKQAAKDGVSVVAVDATSNGKVVGVAFNKIQVVCFYYLNKHYCFCFLIFRYLFWLLLLTVT